MRSLVALTAALLALLAAAPTRAEEPAAVGMTEAEAELASRLASEVPADGAEAASLLSELGNLALERGALDLAEERLARAREIEERLDPRGLGLAVVLRRLGLLAVERGQLEAAEALLLEALEIRQRHEEDSVGLAKLWNNLGVVAGMRGDLEEAERHFARALAVQERLAPMSEDVATLLNNLGIVASEQGDLALAEQRYLRSLEVEEALEPGGPGTSSAWNNLGVVYLRRGNLQRADEAFQHTLELRRTHAPGSVREALALENLGEVADERGDLETAERYFSQALDIRERLAPDSLDVATSVSHLGLLARRRGDLEAAEGAQRRALEIRRRKAPESLDVAASHDELAKLALARADLAAAELRRREPERREPGRPEPGASGSEKDELEKAAAHFRRSLAIREEVVPEGHEIVVSLQGLGLVAHRLGELEKSRTLLERGLAIVEKVAPGSNNEADVCRELALVHRQARRPRTALVYYQRALDALDHQRGWVGGTDEARAGFAALYSHYYTEAIDLLVELGEPARAFDVLERSRARELLALIGARDLELADSARRSGAGRPEPLAAAEVAARLDPGTLLLAYAVGEEASHVFALRATSAQPRVARLEVGRQRLRGEVERFRTFIQQSRRPSGLALEARRLSDLLLAPVAEDLAAAERVTLVVDGPLHYLPFSALADPGADGRAAGGGRYLAETKALHTVASATVWDELRERRREKALAEPVVVAFGDPDYGEAATGGARAAAAGMRLDPLPASRREVEGVRALFPDSSRIFLGAGATEESLRGAAGEAEILHLACHALVDERHPLDSSLALAVPKERAGGSRPEDRDGLLQAWEIFEQLRLDAELVTLSACETGLGKEMAGEGMLGLTRAFQYAGARSVLASLWEVSDTSTAELMRRFYGYLRSGASKAEALRRAQIDLLGDVETAHPYHWAGFELIGDWR